MSVIRRLAPKLCPNCEAPNSLFIDEDRVLTCQLCGWKHNQTEDAKAPEPPKRKKLDYPLTYGTIHPGKIDSWTQAKFNSGIDAVRQERYEDAVRSFEQALGYQSDFLDGHLWLARLSDDPEAKREHYGAIIAYQPNHGESVRELMLLNGQLTQEEAERTAEGREQVTVSPEAPVKAKTGVIKCSVCGGDDLKHYEGEPFATCNTCGNREQVQDTGYGMKSFTMSMIKQRGQAAKWNVGERFLHCNNCGAERTIPATTLKQICPFCGSNHVVHKDALDSFIEPDGIVPFRVRQEQAEEAIWQAVESRSERLKGLFINNKAEQMTVNGVYLPIWYFDTVWQIKRTIRDKNTMNYDRRNWAQTQMSVRTEDMTEAENNWPVYGFTSPEQKLMQRLGRFDVSRVKSYDARLLGPFAAEIYSVDFDRASLKARSELARMLREQHGSLPMSDQEVSVSALLTNMLFRLVMVPVWVATITEADGDVRVGLVHGQTGKAMLGKAQKPEMI